MKVNTQKIGPCRVKLMVKAEADETRKDYEDVVGLFMKNARVPGFRVGKVPREIVTRDFHKELTEEVQRRLFRNLYGKALEQEGIKMVSLLDVGDMLFSPETGILFSMTVDVPPQFDLPKYKKIPLTFDEPEVTDEMLDKYIESLRKEAGKFEDADETHVIGASDLAQIDFHGEIDGRPIVEVAADARPLSDGEGVWLNMEDGRFLPELINALKGMRLNESKEGIEVVYGDDAQIEALRGKTAVYKLTVKAAKVARLPDDEGLLKRLNVESMDILRERCREKLLEMTQQMADSQREQAVMDFLLKKADFELPESQVNDEIRQSLERMLRDAHYRGLKREDLEKNRDEIVGSATENAKRTLRLRYILGGIADQEGITVSDEEVGIELAKAAPSLRMKPEQLRADMEKNERFEDFKNGIREEKTLKFILDGLKK